MTISHVAIQTALRAKLTGLAVCATGLTTLSATATGYARTAGSFLTDGFAPGMELVPAGFTVNPIDTVAAVTALTLTTVSARAAQVAGANRSLTVGLPSRLAYENTALSPDPRYPYLEEAYLPGPSHRVSTGGYYVVEPVYTPRICVPQNSGMLADGKYADALLALFSWNTLITLSTGDQVRVRSDVAPYAGQRLPNATRTHSMIPVAIPLRMYTTLP